MLVMKNILTIIGLLLYLNGFSQNDYETYFMEDSISTMMRIQGVANSDTIRSRNGARFPANGVYRALTIAVNIIYDQTPSANPDTSSTSSVWPYTVVEGININQPSYLPNLFDVENSTPYNGTLTRLYAESSFISLILLSDYMVVNIKQSRVTPNGPNRINRFLLMNAVINYINDNGGLNAIYKNSMGIDTIADYDLHMMEAMVFTNHSSQTEKSIL